MLSDKLKEQKIETEKIRKEKEFLESKQDGGGESVLNDLKQKYEEQLKQKDALIEKREEELVKVQEEVEQMQAEMKANESVEGLNMVGSAIAPIGAGRTD